MSADDQRFYSGCCDCLAWHSNGYPHAERGYWPHCGSSTRTHLLTAASDYSTRRRENATPTTVDTRRSIANFALGAAADCPEWCFDAAEHGLTFLREAHRAADGYHLVVDSGGEPLNQTRSAYGHAFALLAYAHDNHGSEDEIRPDTPFTTLLQFGAIAVAVIGSVAVVLESTFFSRRKDQK